MTAAAPSTSEQIVALLRAHYFPANRPPGGIFATEIEAPNGSRRADVLWAPLTTYGGSGLVGHEIKVTRSDLINELSDPMKADPWAKHCVRWWLTVSDPSMLTGLDIPDAWGIMGPPSGRLRRSMTIIRPAPRLNPVNDGPGWHRLAAWQHNRLARQLEDALRDVERLNRERASWHDMAERNEFRRMGLNGDRAEQVGRILKAIEERRYEKGAVYLSHDDLKDEDVIEALLDLGRIRSLSDRLKDDLRWRLQEAKGMVEAIDKLAKDLTTLTQPRGQSVPRNQSEVAAPETGDRRTS